MRRAPAALRGWLRVRLAAIAPAVGVRAFTLWSPFRSFIARTRAFSQLNSNDWANDLRDHCVNWASRPLLRRAALRRA